MPPPETAVARKTRSKAVKEASDVELSDIDSLSPSSDESSDEDSANKSQESSAIQSQAKTPRILTDQEIEVFVAPMPPSKHAQSEKKANRKTAADLEGEDREIQWITTRRGYRTPVHRGYCFRTSRRKVCGTQRRDRHADLECHTDNVLTPVPLFRVINLTGDVICESAE